MVSFYLLKQAEIEKLLSGGHHGMDALLSRYSGCELLLAAIDSITTLLEEVYCM